MRSIDLLTTGQMAEIHGIHKKTLMYYDQIDLFKPCYRDDKGYRFYHNNQHESLEAILALREIEVSIAELLEYNSQKSLTNLKELLKLKEIIIDEKIKKLINIQKYVATKLESLESLNSLETIEISNCEEEKIYVHNFSTDMDVNGVIRQLSDLLKSYERRLLLGKWGYTIDLADVYKDNYQWQIYVKGDFEELDHYIALKPRGKYLIYYHQGDNESLKNAYDIILKYCSENNIDLHNRVYEEKITDDLSSTSPSEYITKIMIQIKP